jgi:hypothetical protein
MTTSHDSDPDATVRMPRPVPPKDADLEQIDPDSTLIREDWGSAAILPPEDEDASTPTEQAPTTAAVPPEWEKTLRRPLYKSEGGPC